VETGKSIRLQLTVQYDGSGFHGWQLQPELRTVQGELESALSRLADRPTSVIGSGRTDAGVHALGQVASVDMPDRWSPAELERALSAILPYDVWIERVRRVRADFHPRYSAIARSYEYRVGTRRESHSPFHRRWCWPLCEALARPPLDESAKALIGEHSFVRFAKSGQPERGNRCTVADARWSEWDLGLSFRITADRYLHHMVRYLVGTMVDVARGRRPASDLGALLNAEDGLETSPPAPSQGLFLVRVEYPDHFHLVDEPTPHSERSAFTA
jgi:tRNA pseudouridine38-40 synthase